MQSAATEKRIILHFFQASGSVKALFIARGSVARGRFTLGLGLSAFENDDVAWHGSGLKINE